ncbi:hypothetical protein BD311DRAFT_757123 [Dichomitus squalens]|uniref:Uncharacterized protein n=1 Tax=Dichomitus squalens TaxID=114155 RepID=A0A4Q9MSI8_9APHY|nr:hypothetical protein BD311DRAFT_757123 [Dichomitus squalens]
MCMRRWWVNKVLCALSTTCITFLCYGSNPSNKDPSRACYRTAQEFAKCSRNLDVWR